MIGRSVSLIVLALAGLTGCGEREPAPRPGSEEPGPIRLAIMAPGAAELVDALGLLDQAVAGGDFVTWPPEAARLPRIGSYDNPNLERLLELDATHYLSARSEAAALAHERVARLGVQVLALDLDTFRGVMESLQRLGEVLGQPERAAREKERIQAELEEVRAACRGLPRRRVLVAVGQRPLYVAGPGSHIDELVQTAGGSLVARSEGAPYQLLSLEAALEGMPEVVIDLSDNHPTALRGAVAGQWGRWGFLPAVEYQRVWHLDPVQLAIPGPRLPEMARLLAHLIHPEAFGPPDEAQLDIRSGRDRRPHAR